MKPNIDLTENSDFSRESGHNLGSLRRYFKVRLFPHWTEKCLTRPDEILKECGVRTFSQPTEFPPSDRCECCGRPKLPWKILCRRCDGQICTPDENKGLPRNPKMISNPRDLHI